MSMNDSNTQSMPPSTASLVQGAQFYPAQLWWRLWFFLFTSVRNLLANALTVFGGQTVKGGFTIEEFDLGTPANGTTVTPNPSDCCKQVVTNDDGGFEIAATGECGDIELRIVNGPGAGPITFAGFKMQYLTGVSLDAVNGNEFVVFIFGFGTAGADYSIQARQ